MLGSMGLHEDRTKLQKAMAKLVAQREHLDGVRGKAQDRASQQLDTMPHAIKTASDHVARGKGGILAHRYLKKQLVQDQRLRAIAARREGSDNADG